MGWVEEEVIHPEEEVIHPEEEVIQLIRFYCQPQSQLGIGIRGLGLGLDNNNKISSRYSTFYSPSLLIGAESRAERMAKYELKLFIFLNHFIILMNFVRKRSRS